MTIKSVDLFLCILCVQSVHSQTLQDANSLYTKLATNYDKRVRPGVDHSRPTIVYFSVSILSINELEEKNNKLSLSMGFHINWIDERIRWNSSDYGGISSVQLPKDEVWLPGIGLVNMYDSLSMLSELDTKVHYNNEGYAKWNTGGLYVVICAADVSFYPFDTQECEISFTQIGYTVMEVLILPGRVVDSVLPFVPNGVWERINTSISTEVVEMLGLKVIHVHLKLRRRFDFYAVTLLAPITITMFCNLFAFLIPAHSGERVSFSVTILLAMTVFMTIVSDTLPKNSYPDLPYLCFSILMDVVSSSIITACSIITMRVHFKENDDHIPNYLKCLVKWCCKHIIIKSSLKKGGSKSVTDLDQNNDIDNSEQCYIPEINMRGSRILKHGQFKCLPKTNMDENIEHQIKNKENNTVSWKDFASFLDILMLTVFATLMIIKIIIFAGIYSQHVLCQNA